MMVDIEKRLMKEKDRINVITAPEKLEVRLEQALEQVPVRKGFNKNSIWKIAIAAILLFSLIGYNYNALAYYSKKIIGFDEVLYGDLKELNEQGMGQMIDKSIQLDKDTTLTIDGMMTDENRLVLFCTLKNPNGIDEDHNYLSFSEINGFLTNANVQSGSAILSDEIGRAHV